MPLGPCWPELEVHDEHGTALDSALAEHEGDNLCEAGHTGFFRMGCIPAARVDMVGRELDTGLIAGTDAAAQVALAASGAPLELNAWLLAADNQSAAARMQIPEIRSCCVVAGEHLGEKGPWSRVRCSRCCVFAAEDAALASALASDAVEEAVDLARRTARSMLAKENDTLDA